MRRGGIILIVLGTTITILLFLRFFGETRQIKNIANSMILTSPAFEEKGNIPKKFTCDGGDINPELLIQHVPENAKSLVLIVDDPDASRGFTFTHWIVWNINPDTTLIKEESVPSNASEGITDFKKASYGGPCPPPGKPHRYFFKLYALDVERFEFGSLPTKEDLEEAMRDHVIEKAELVGIYTRQN